MGVDITAFIEFLADGYTWSYSQILLLRDKHLFEALKTFPVRGLPENLGDFAEGAFFTHIVEMEEEKDWRGERYVPRAKADEYVRSGESLYLKTKQNAFETSYVSNPRYFDASWLTLEELEVVLEGYRQSYGDTISWDFLVALETMRNIEKHVGQGKTRLVFWFDA